MKPTRNADTPQIPAAQVVGPADLNTSFVSEGVEYTVRAGKVHPPITPDLVPSNLFGLGLRVVPAGSKE